MEYSQVALLGHQGCFQNFLRACGLGVSGVACISSVSQSERAWVLAPELRRQLQTTRAAPATARLGSGSGSGAPLLSPQQTGARRPGLLSELLLRQHGGQELPGAGPQGPGPRAQGRAPIRVLLSGTLQELHTPKARGASRGASGGYRLCAGLHSSTGSRGVQCDITNRVVHPAQEDCRTSTVRRICLDFVATRFSCPMAQSLQQPLAGQLAKVSVGVGCMVSFAVLLGLA